MPSKGKPNQGSAANADPDALQEFEVVDREGGTTHIEYRDARARDSGGK